MPAGTIALIVMAIAVPTMWWAIVYGLPLATDKDTAIPDEAVWSAEIVDRVSAERSLRTDSWQLEPTHRAPDVPYTPEQAHAEMQRHRECAIDRCAAKHSAFWTLVDTGHAVPDTRAVR